MTRCYCYSTADCRGGLVDLQVQDVHRFKFRSRGMFDSGQLTQAPRPVLTRLQLPQMQRMAYGHVCLNTIGTDQRRFLSLGGQPVRVMFCSS